MICGLFDHPISHLSMFIGQGLTLNARRAAQAERRSANTAKVPASAAAVAAAASTAAAATTEQLCQHLRHSSLSPHLPKWIPLPLHQPARPSMERPLLSPVVCRLLSMLRIYRRVAGRWHIGGVMTVSGCCRRGATVGGGGRTRQSTLGGRWEGGA